MLDITSGKTDEAGPLIRDKFGANYVFTDGGENDEMVAKLLGTGWADIVYEDDEARLLKIRDQKGDPPKDAEDSPETPEEKEELDRMEQNDNANSGGNGNANAPVEDEEPAP